MSDITRQDTSRPSAAADLPPMKSVIVAIALISGVVNLLALTGPLFMLQVYDRVLSSRSIPTLLALAGIAAVLYGFQALLDLLRSRILLRLGERFDARLSRRIYDIVLAGPLRSRQAGDGLQPVRDLDSVRGFLGSQGPTAIFDLPWMPVYLAICFAFHFWIGMTALVGAIVLIIATLLTDVLTRKFSRRATALGGVRDRLARAGRDNAEVVAAMGMGARLYGHWRDVHGQFLAANRQIGDVGVGLGSVARALRMMLQSAILGVGAWLVVEQQVTAGVIIASSVMMGRALAPVDLAIGNWKFLLAARQSWARLKLLLAHTSAGGKPMALPAPHQDVRAEGITIVPPGEKTATVENISFRIEAGCILGVVGPSGSGKSTLARALVGAWPLARGRIRLDGASLDQWDTDTLGAHIGYLPQEIGLFEGTIAQNISRFAAEPDAEQVIAAAVTAGVHELILSLESGYDTQLGEGGAGLSTGQRQRIGLARALYGDPFIIVLDEPNAHLDSKGEHALAMAMEQVRLRGGLAILVTHRPSSLRVADQVLVMEGGRLKAFGPRDEILQNVLGVAVPAGGQSGAVRSPMPFRVVPSASLAPETPEAG